MAIVTTIMTSTPEIAELIPACLLKEEYAPKQSDYVVPFIRGGRHIDVDEQIPLF